MYRICFVTLVILFNLIVKQMLISLLKEGNIIVGKI